MRLQLVKKRARPGTRDHRHAPVPPISVIRVVVTAGVSSNGPYDYSR
jgi:hypothetical protein